MLDAQVTPYSVSGLAEKNSGTAAGDLFFRLGDELWLPAFCLAHPELHYERCPGPTPPPPPPPPPPTLTAAW